MNVERVAAAFHISRAKAARDYMTADTKKRLGQIGIAKKGQNKERQHDPSALPQDH